MLSVSTLTFWLARQDWWPTDGSQPLAAYGPDKLRTLGLEDRAVFVTPTPGVGLMLEQTFDVTGAQFRIRGAVDDYDDAEALAIAIDKGIVNAWPTIIGTKQVGRIDRVGGAPAYLLRDEGRRSHFTGNYLFTAAY